MSVDADGAPNAYGPHGVANALDNLGNAGHPGNWWGIVTDKHGNPVVQDGVAPKQPCAGFYISTTSLYENVLDETDVRHFADATKVPYVALPPTYLHSTGLTIGDFTLLINANNGKHVYAVFADTKHKPVLGEISIAAAAALGAPTDARHGSLPSGIVTLVFPGSGIGQGSIPDAHLLDVCGRMSLQHFARFHDKDTKLPDAYPEFPMFMPALTRAGYMTI